MTVVTGVSVSVESAGHRPDKEVDTLVGFGHLAGVPVDSVMSLSAPQGAAAP